MIDPRVALIILMLAGGAYTYEHGIKPAAVHVKNATVKAGKAIGRVFYHPKKPKDAQAPAEPTQ